MKQILILVFFSFFLIGCSNDDEINEEKIKKSVNAWMTNLYPDLKVVAYYDFAVNYNISFEDTEEYKNISKMIENNQKQIEELQITESNHMMITVLKVTNRILLNEFLVEWREKYTNKTYNVKIDYLPYDLEDMELLTTTFLLNNKYEILFYPNKEFYDKVECEVEKELANSNN